MREMDGEAGLRQHKQIQNQTQPQRSPNNEQERNSSTTKASNRTVNHSTRPAWKNSTEKTVLVISLCTLVAYPLSFSVSARFMLSLDYSQAVETKIVLSAGLLCHVLNSSINVLIYWFFASRFRELAAILRARLSSLLTSRSRGQGSPRAPSAAACVPGRDLA